MNEEYCPDCEASFQFYKDAKLKKTQGKTDEDVKPLKERAKQLSAKIKFFYPILDRDHQQAKVLEVGIGVRNKIDAEVKSGRDVMKFDYTLLVTEKPGADYYILTRLDSLETSPLSEKELKQVEVAKQFNLQEIVMGGRESSQEHE
jgi:hypothetical protein